MTRLMAAWLIERARQIEVRSTSSSEIQGDGLPSFAFIRGDH
jgi:hypothetical protein